MVFHNALNGTSSYGTVLSFSTLQPAATTLAATSITGSGATLNGTVNPQGSPGCAYFLWGTNSSILGSNTTCYPVVANMTAQPFSSPISGLTSGTTYYFQMVFHNALNGTSSYGTILSFSTLQVTESGPPLW
jgi:hypothetical protein